MICLTCLNRFQTYVLLLLEPRSGAHLSISVGDMEPTTGVLFVSGLLIPSLCIIERFLVDGIFSLASGTSSLPM